MGLGDDPEEADDDVDECCSPEDRKILQSGRDDFKGSDTDWVEGDASPLLDTGEMDLSSL